MIEGPHIFGFSPVAVCMSLTRALASARLVWSVSALMNAVTLTLVGLVLFSAMFVPQAFVCAHYLIPVTPTDCIERISQMALKGYSFTACGKMPLARTRLVSGHRQKRKPPTNQPAVAGEI